MKYLTLSMSYPPLFALIKSIACGLALLASGQAAALSQYTASGITSPNLTTLAVTDWTTGGASCGVAATTSNATNGDDFEICATSVTYAAGGTSPITGKITLNMGGGTLTLPDSLTLSGNLWVFNATLALGSSTLTMPAGSLLENGKNITMTSGGITFGAGSTLDHYAASSAFTAGIGTITFNGAGTIKSSATGAALVLYDVVSAGGLTINHGAAGASVKIGRNLTIGGNVTGVGGGELILPNAAHTITSTAPSVTISSLLSSLASGAQTITLVPASAVGNSITVTAYGTIGATVTVNCTGGVFTGSVTGATATLGASGGSFTCTKTGGTVVNAPIDLHFSKQVETFATEIDLK